MMTATSCPAPVRPAASTLYAARTACGVYEGPKSVERLNPSVLIFPFSWRRSFWQLSLMLGCSPPIPSTRGAILSGRLGSLAADENSPWSLDTRMNSTPSDFEIWSAVPRANTAMCDGLSLAMVQVNHQE